MKKILFNLVFIVCLVLSTTVHAELLEMPKEAEEITSYCAFSSNVRESKKNETSLMTDRDVSTYYALKEKGGWLVIESSEPMWGVSVMLYNRYGKDYSYDLQIEEEGEWKTVSSSKYLSNWHLMDKPATKIRLMATSKERLRIAEIQLFGKGEKPAEVQTIPVVGDEK